jgi:hypothetical protein
MLKKIAFGAGALGFSVSSFAALPASVATDAATAATDALTLGGIVLGLVVSIAMFKHLRSAK